MATWMFVSVLGATTLGDVEFIAALLGLLSCVALGWLVIETFNTICDPRENELMEVIECKYPRIYKEVRTLRRQKHTEANITYLHEIIADLRVQYPLRRSTFERLIWVFTRYAFLIVNFSVITYLMMQWRMAVDFNGMSPDSPYWRHLYYHVVTVTTVGYGDIYPKGDNALSYFVVIIELTLTFVLIMKIVNFFQGAARLTMDNLEQAIRVFLLSVHN